MRAQEFANTKLVIFDIDDTLVNTDTKVGVVRDGKTVRQLNSHDFTHYKLQPGEQFDFGAFRDAREFFANARPIAPMIRQLRNDIATGNKVIMVTARADFDDRETFLNTFRKYGVDMDRVHVYRAGNIGLRVPTEEKKKMIIRRVMGQDHFDKVIMYDDALPNLQAFLSLASEYPWSRFYAWHVDRDGSATEYHRSTVKEDTAPQAAGCILYAEDTGRWGFQQRSDSVSDPGVWSTWGGGRDPDETVEQCVRRELAEEAGYHGPIQLESLDSNSTYVTFIGRVPQEFEPQINNEVKDWCWVNDGDWPQPMHHKLLESLNYITLQEDTERGAAKMQQAVLDFYQNEVGPIQLEPVEDFTVKAKELLKKADPSIRDRVLAALKKANQNPYIQGGVITTVGSVLAGGILASAQKMGLTPTQTNIMLQAVLNTVIPTMVSRVNGKSWRDTIKYTLASAGIGTGIATMTENFADGKKPGRKGLAKRMGVPTRASVSRLRQIAKSSSGEKARMAHWMANMKAGRKK